MILKKYEEIADDFTDSLILGNGASIAFSKNFRYNSLYDKASEEGFVTNNVAKVFALLDTKDFEFVLSHLWYAREINTRLGIRESKTKKSYDIVKKALIGTVLKVHPKPSDVEGDLSKIASFAKNFKKVFSLNYDLIVYWAMLRANEEMGGHHFKDCFYNGVFSPDWSYYEEPRPPVTASTLVFYPHGNLCLIEKHVGKTTRDQEEGNDAIELTRSELKIESHGRLLLAEITDRWKKPGITPLFVSEGTWREKFGSINSSGYLSDVYYSALPKAGNNITIYGWTMSGQDEHILKALKRSKVQKIAVSVHKPTTPDINQHIFQTRTKLKQFISNKLQIVFFDAESDGCWIY